VTSERAEQWVPIGEAFAKVDAYEREGRPILGIEIARITPDEKILLPAFADFASVAPEESWDFARELLTARVPSAATHATFAA